MSFSRWCASFALVFLCELLASGFLVSLLQARTDLLSPLGAQKSVWTDVVRFLFHTGTGSLALLFIPSIVAASVIEFWFHIRRED